jgi:DNA mismatch repair ATPase MutS
VLTRKNLLYKNYKINGKFYKYFIEDSMEEQKEMILTVPLKGNSCRMFELCFAKSPFESRTEYIRHLIHKEYEDKHSFQGDE